MQPDSTAVPAGPRLDIRALSKTYASLVLADVDLELRAGEVHALVGANGAGKSTLARCVCGLTRPDRGRMRLDGQPYAPSSKREAERRGVRIVLQEPSLIGSLTIAENLFLDELPSRFGFIDVGRLHATARPALAAVGLADLDPALRVGRLGIGQQQAVEIAAALAGACRLLILDEPTSALTSPEIDRLFDRVRRLTAAGGAILYMSHRMDEVRTIADRVTVLRDGRIVATEPARDVSLDHVVELMVGRPVAQHARRWHRAGQVALRVEGLRRGAAVRDINFELHRGEVLGLAGLVGSGRTETLRALFGADPADAGRVTVAGREHTEPFDHPAEAMDAGIGLVPEDRVQLGLLMSQSIRVNTTLASLADLVGPFGWIRADAERRTADRQCETLGVQRISSEQLVAELSGGNQQKVLMARWLMRECDVMLLDEPTRGIDVAARQAIYRLLDELAARGKALVVVSSELRELMEICDRIAVISAGRIVATFARGEWTEAAITNAAFSGYLDAGA